MFDHKTDSPETLMYIDEVKDSQDAFLFKGWIAHSSEEVMCVTLGDKFITAAKILRPDVAKAYSWLPSEKVGVEFSVPKQDIREPFGIRLMSGKQIALGDLRKWKFKLNGFQNLEKSLVVVDDFYADPDFVREFGMSLKFSPSGYHKGMRSSRYVADGTKEAFEKILGRRVTNWNHQQYANGVFQFCTKDDPIVYHVDSQTFAAVVYLTPDAPLSSGTSTYKSKITGLRRLDEKTSKESFVKTFGHGGDEINFFDNSTFEQVDRVANLYNRLVMWDAKAIHAADGYFGNSIKDSRFFHLFFFDVE